MKWSVKSDRKYLLSLLIFCLLIPHGLLSLVTMASASGEWAPAQIENWRITVVYEYVPILLVFFAYQRMQRMERFSLMPAVLSALILASYLPRYETRGVLVMAGILPMILLLEGFVVLKKLEGCGKMLSGLAADYKMLRSFFLWSVCTFAFVFLISEAINAYRSILSPLYLIPLPGFLIFDAMRQQKKCPSTIWGMLALIPMMTVSLYLATLGPMEMYRLYHQMILLCGYVLFFLIQIVYYIVPAQERPAA